MISSVWIGITAIALGLIGGYISLRERLVRLEVKIDVFWRDVSYSSAKLLHKPHPDSARMDYLIDKYLDDKLNQSEIVEFIGKLKELFENKDAETAERQSAAILLAALRQRYKV